MKLRSINNAKLRCGDYSWRFELQGHHSIQVTQTTFPSGRVETVTIARSLLPAFVRHLVKGLQELKEVQQRSRGSFEEVLTHWKVAATKR